MPSSKPLRPTHQALSPLLRELSDRLWGSEGLLPALTQTRAIVLVDALRHIHYDAQLRVYPVEIKHPQTAAMAHIRVHGIELEPNAIFSSRLYDSWQSAIQVFLEHAFYHDPTGVFPGWRPQGPLEIYSNPLSELALSQSEQENVKSTQAMARDLILDLSGEHLHANTVPAQGVSQRIAL